MNTKKSFVEERDSWHKATLEEKERIISVNNYERK